MTIMTIKKTEGPYDYCRSLRFAFWFDANETQSFELLANRYGQNILLLQLEILIFVFSIIHQEEFMLPWLKVLPWQCAPLSFVKLILKKLMKQRFIQILHHYVAATAVSTNIVCSYFHYWKMILFLGDN